MSHGLLYFFHFFLSLVLFALIGRIGRLLSPFGYVSVFSFNARDESPAFNFVYRVGFPVLYIVVLTYTLLFLNIYEFSKNIWVIVPIYFSLRIIFIIIMERVRLFNFAYFISVFACSTLLSWKIYDKFLSNGDLLLPDKENFTSEIWFICILFAYNVLNKIDGKKSYNKRKYREERYIKHTYNRIRDEYGYIIDAVCDSTLRRIIYSILIIENFNRPRIPRAIERLLGGERSYGIMQVKSKFKLSDVESIKLGVDKISKDYEEVLPGKDSSYMIRHDTIRKYNPCDDYVLIVDEVHNILWPPQY